MVKAMYINMHDDNIKGITCYIIAVHIMAQYLLINGISRPVL